MPAAMALSVERKSIRVRGTFADGRFVFLSPYQPGALIFFSFVFFSFSSVSSSVTNEACLNVPVFMFFYLFSSLRCKRTSAR